MINGNERIYMYFDQITQIPHGSYNEKGISDWLVSFAEEHQLRYIQDEMMNVIIYKEGAGKQKDKAPVILQAHMDMVCEKQTGLDFYFMTQPLDTYIEEGWLKARGTTLGADDGVGVAMMLAILESKDLEHPPLECVFTVLEEVGLNGAQGLKKEYFSAHRMVNLDCGGETKTAVSTAGGLCCTLTHVSAMQKHGDSGWQLEVSGLLGGHSGSNINKERGNANKIAIRCLRELVKERLKVWIADWNGGDKDNAIPRSCMIRFVCQDSPKVRKCIDRVREQVAAELKASDPDVQITLERVDKIDKVYSAQESEDFINFISVLPTGKRSESMAIKGLTWASENLASLKREGAGLTITVSLRSAQQSWIDLMADELKILASLFDWNCTFSNGYPAWDYAEESQMRKTMEQVVRNRTGETLQLEAGHGGTECGVFCKLIPGIDIVTMVPEATGAHTPQEMLNLESFKRTYETLCELLSVVD